MQPFHSQAQVILRPVPHSNNTDSCHYGQVIAISMKPLADPKLSIGDRVKYHREHALRIDELEGQQLVTLSINKVKPMMY